MKYFLSIVIISMCALSVSAQNVKYIQLKQERIVYTPKGYHIADVVDDRDETPYIGVLNGSGKKEKLSFLNSAAVTLQNFIANNVRQNKAQQAVSLHISKLYFDIRKRGVLSDVEASVLLKFYVGDKQVVEYSSKGEGQMTTDPAVYIESFVRQAIGNDLKKFDEWWVQNRGKIPTRQDVKVNVSIARTTDKPNYIVYSTHRLLQIPDFAGPINGQEHELAVTVSGIGLGYSASAQNSQIVVDVTITPYFNKSLSWFKSTRGNDRVLAHEQTHFDITAIKACELAAAIRNTTFTQDNYIQQLEELQTKNAQASNDEENLYDNETNHGTIHDRQEAWEKKITAQVRAIGCYL